MWVALSRRMVSRPTNVIEMTASRRSERRTSPTTRRTSARGSGNLRPLTSTSLTLGRLEFRRLELWGSTAARTGIPDPLMVGAGHDPGKLALDPVEVAEGERGVVQLPGSHLLLHQLLDCAAHCLGRRIVQHPDEIGRASCRERVEISVV